MGWNKPNNKLGDKISKKKKPLNRTSQWLNLLFYCSTYVIHYQTNITIRVTHRNIYIYMHIVEENQIYLNTKLYIIIIKL